MLACGRALAGVVADETALKLELSDGSFDFSSPFDAHAAIDAATWRVYSRRGRGCSQALSGVVKVFRLATPPAHYMLKHHRSR